jgi:transposase InsO family protein
MAITEEMKIEVALFRFGLIAPIINNQVDDVNAYLETVSSRVHDVPHYGKKEYTSKTIRIWLNEYRHGGLDALKPQKRKDRGSSRVISNTLGEKIIAYRNEHPAFSVMLLYEQMAKEGMLLRSDVSYHTVYRFLKYRGLEKPSLDQVTVKDRKKFAFEQVNRMWQGDMMAGPYIYVQGKKKPTYLFAFIDDCSRLITFARFELSQNFDAMKKIYIEAILRRGIQQIVYLDNGKIYRSKLFHEACARMGTTISHTEPYDAASKGKIERFFRTVRERFLPLMPHNMSSINELNQSFFRWLEEDYHRKIHSGLGMSPLDKYLSQVKQLKVVSDPDWVSQLFLRREERRVNNDATISINGCFFEVSPALIGQRIQVRFEPADLNQVWVYAGDELIGTGRLAKYSLVGILK